MAEFIAAVKAALPGVLVSALVTGIMLYYIRKYIDRKLQEDEEKRKEEHQLRLDRSELEQKRRRCLGRLLFWLHHGLTKPPPNGELESAMAEFQAVEEDLKELDRKILAEVEVRGHAS